MKQRINQFTLLFVFIPAPCLLFGQHHAGEGCITCHNGFKIGGTLFSDTTAISVTSGVPLKLTSPDGGQIVLNPSDSDGRIWETIVEEGDYLISIGEIKSRTWHNIPSQVKMLMN